MPLSDIDFDASRASVHLMYMRTVATLAVASTLLLVASCAEEPTEPLPRTGVTPDAAPSYPPVPTPEDLNAEVTRGLDPAVPLEQKVMFVQGAEDDPALIGQVVDAAVVNDATVEITSIDDLGDGSLNAGATVTIAGEPNPGSMRFVAEDGVWKLSREDACSLVGLAGLTTTACPAV